MASRGGFEGARRQWGSGSSGRDGGCGGRYDSGYGGRDGGGRGVSHGYDRDQQDRYGHGSHDVYDGGATVGNDSKSFHESMMANRNNTSRSRSRSRSPIKNSGWGENPGRALSRSMERFDTVAPTHRSFYEMMMERARTSDPHIHRERSQSPTGGNRKETFGGSDNGNDKQTFGRSPGQQQGTEELADEPSQS